MPENSLSVIQFTTENILKELEKLKTNKSCGPDNLHPRVLKELSPVICDVLKVMFENQWALVQSPYDWKTSNISVIHKKGPKHDVENYRPISSTCIACKIMESIIIDNIAHYFNVNKLFSNYTVWFY